MFQAQPWTHSLTMYRQLTVRFELMELDTASPTKPMVKSRMVLRCMMFVEFVCFDSGIERGEPHRDSLT